MKRRGEPALPRPQPSYTAWLEKQSMLAQADRLIGQVSQTDRVWMFATRGMPLDTLLKAAPQWLDLSSARFPGEAFLRRVSADFSQLANTGVKGLYLGPLGEDQSFWQDKGSENFLKKYHLSASLELDPRLGDARDLELLEKAAEDAGLELGADILAARTSMGPDFFLQARHARGHAGLYAMLELPRHLWSEAPEGGREWEGMALSPEQVKNFSGKGILPENLFRDNRPWGSPAGWAITGEVLGTDGNPRRWLYRYEGDVNSPVLLWQDPSGLAARIFSASIIQQTGFWRLPLAGLRLAAFMGLEPQKNTEEAADDISDKSVSPGLEALGVLSDQIHRYGGWALQADSVPTWLVERILEGSCDFCREDTSERLLLQAVAKENPSGLAGLYKRWIEKDIDQRRLARGLDSADLDSLPSSSSGSFHSDSAARNASPLHPVLHWRLGLPGLAFLSLSDLGLHEGPDIPQKGSSALECKEALRRLLVLRAEYGLAEGKLVRLIESGKSALALLSLLPGRGYWLLAGNFSSSPARIAFALPQKCQSALDALSGKDLSQHLDDNGQNFSLSLEGFETRQVIITDPQ